MCIRDSNNGPTRFSKVWDRTWTLSEKNSELTCLESSRTICENFRRRRRRSSAVFSGANMAVAIAVLSIVLGVLVVLRPDVTRVRDGRVLAFLALFLLPSMAVWAGVSQHMDRAKTTAFCLSCHTMEDYGRSLYVDDRSYLPAAHFQNNRVPRDHACYTCPV